MPASETGAVAPTPPARFVAGAVILSGVLAAGLLGGYTAARQGGRPGGEGHAGESEEEHAGHAAHGPAAPRLSERTLANLGVVVGEAVLGEHVTTRDIPALVAPIPGSERRVVAPVAGTIVSVAARSGDVVAAGAPLAVIRRSAFPQVSLSLTQPILAPLNEAHHEAAVGVQRAALALALARAEQERLSPEGSADRVAGRVVREAQYAVKRAELELLGARHEAERHGIDAETIATLERGEGEVPDVPDVRRVLRRNRLWSPEADALLAALPADVQTLPYALAVLGELVGASRLPHDVVEAARAQPALAAHFLDVAGLLQQGATSATLLALAASGALEPLVTVRAPAEPAPDWDLFALVAQPGLHVEAGDELARLRDDRAMDLLLAPAPSEGEALAKALALGEALVAEPLVGGAGPLLPNVHLLALTGTSEHEAPGARARAANLALPAPPGAAGPRSWALRPGLTYVVRLPLTRTAPCFVLPPDAIAYRVAEALVLLEDGGTFRPVPVRLVHHDAREAVVAAQGGLFPGDRLVIKGAPALALALLAGQGAAADPHAGHNH